MVRKETRRLALSYYIKPFTPPPMVAHRPPTNDDVSTAVVGQYLQAFTSNGGFISAWGVRGSGDGELRLPFGLTVDALGNVYVADTFNGRVQKFTGEGPFRLKVHFYILRPVGIVVDASGTVYVADGEIHQVSLISDG